MLMPTRAFREGGSKVAGPTRLRRRREFLRVAASGVSRSQPSFKIQMALRDDDLLDAPRFGVTVTKKTAGAVARNRIRRRLKEALRLGGALAARKGCDYVLVARRATLTTPFCELIQQMAEGLTRIGRSGEAGSSPNRGKKPRAP